jgi:hypothetical protein
MLIHIGPVHESHIMSNTMCSPLILELLKVLLDFLIIRVQIGDIYFPTSRDRDALTYKNAQVSAITYLLANKV